MDWDKSFNPCFSGLCFGTVTCGNHQGLPHMRFNPCFSGLCFGTNIIFLIVSAPLVLILVLVDYALEPLYLQLFSNPNFSFNPCFSGLCFGTGADVEKAAMEHLF